MNTREYITSNDNTIRIPLCYEQNPTVKPTPCYVTIDNQTIDLKDLEFKISNLLIEINNTKDTYIKEIYMEETRYTKTINLDDANNLMHNFSILNKIIPNIKKLYNCVNEFFNNLETQALKIQEAVLNYKNFKAQLDLISDTFILQDDNIKNTKKYQAFLRRLISLKTKITNSEIKINNAIFKYNSLITPLQNGIFTFDDGPVNVRVLLNDMFDTNFNKSHLYKKFNEIADQILKKGYHLQISSKTPNNIIPIPPVRNILNLTNNQNEVTVEETGAQEQNVNNQDQGEEKMETQEPQPSGSSSIDAIKDLTDMSDQALISQMIYLVTHRAYEGKGKDEINEVYNKGKQSLNSFTRTLIEDIFNKKKSVAEILDQYRTIPTDRDLIVTSYTELEYIINNLPSDHPNLPELKELLQSYKDTLDTYRSS